MRYFKHFLDFTLIASDNTPIFAAGKVECIGQIVGAVVCEDDKTARRTAKLVKIEYELLDAILTMEVSFSFLEKLPNLISRKPSRRNPTYPIRLSWELPWSTLIKFCKSRTWYLKVSFS